MRAFADAPAVVAALLNDVDHLPQVLPDFAAPQRAVFRSETELPELAMPVRPDFVPGVIDSHKRVVVRNSVRQRIRATVDVNPQNGAEQIGDVLPGLSSVGNTATVAGDHVEVAVRSEANAAAVVAA